MSKDEIPIKVKKVFDAMDRYLGSLNHKPRMLPLSEKDYMRLLNYYNKNREKDDKLTSVPNYADVPVGTYHPVDGVKDETVQDSPNR